MLFRSVVGLCVISERLIFVVRGCAFGGVGCLVAVLSWASPRGLVKKTSKERETEEKELPYPGARLVEGVCLFFFFGVWCCVLSR